MTVPRALLLEDSTSCAIVAAGVLRGLGYRVERYGWVKAALCAIEGPRFDVYVIDAGVPQSAGGVPGSGLDVARRVLARYSDARVIVWSAADATCARVIFAHKDAGPDGLRKAVTDLSPAHGLNRRTDDA